MKYPHLYREPNKIDIKDIININKKRVLITGGGHAELPLIASAQALGYYVISTGNNYNGPGHIASDAYVPGDFSDKEFVLSLARDLEVCGIISGCNDFAYLSTAYACEKLGLPGHDPYYVSCQVHHKNEFRDAMEAAGIRTPKRTRCEGAEDVEKAIELLGIPLVIKPVDLTGGKGVVVCRTSEQAKSAFLEAIKVTREKFVIAEEFIDGTNHGATCLIKNGKIVFHMEDREQYGTNKYLVAGAATPSLLSEDVISELLRQIETVALHLKLCDGLFHVQFIVDEKGPVLIDPCRRTPGDLYILLAYYTTGVDYAMQIVKAELSLGIEDHYDMEENIIARECILPDKAGVIKNIIIDDEIKAHMASSYVWAEVGDVVEDAMKYRGGIIVTQYDSVEIQQKVLSEYSNHCRIEVI